MKPTSSGSSGISTRIDSSKISQPTSTRPKPTSSTISRSTISSRDAQASCSRLYGNIEATISSQTGSVATVPAPRKTISRPQPIPLSSSTTTTSTLPRNRPTLSSQRSVAPTSSTAPSASRLVSTTRPTTRVPVTNSRTMNDITVTTTQIPSSTQPLSSMHTQSSLVSLSRSEISTTTVPTNPTTFPPQTLSNITPAPRLSIPITTRRVGRQAPSTPQPKHILSVEAKALLADLDQCQTQYIHEHFLSIEKECVLLHQQLDLELQFKMTSGEYNESTVQLYEDALIDAREQYQSSLSSIRSQQGEYKSYVQDHYTNLQSQQDQHLFNLKKSHQEKIDQLTQRVSTLGDDVRQISMNKLSLSKAIQQFNSTIMKNTLLLEKVTKTLTPQQKLDLLDLRKQILAVMKKKELFEASEQDQLNKKREHDEQSDQFVLAELYRRQLHNLLQDIRGSIRVLCRIRPLMAHDGETEYKTLRYEPEVSRLRLTTNKGEHTYEFDNILGPDSTQDDVFEEVHGVVQSAIDGYDVCLFSYGQTGSGKSHTMTGDLHNETMKGIIPRSVDLIFDKTHELKTQGWNFSISVSCCQIYQEKIFDLLSNNGTSKKLEIINDREKQKIIVTGLTKNEVRSVPEVNDALITATNNRTVAKTSMNAESSRSHFVFTLHVEMSNSITNEKRVGTLNLCDLAGSERINSAKTTGQQLEETKKINQSLSSLSHVFESLAKKTSHIPFSDSQLTKLLQYCLSGSGKTMMIVNLSPTASSAPETKGSLKLAEIVSSIQKGKSKQNVTKDGIAIVSNNTISTASKSSLVRKAPADVLTPPTSNHAMTAVAPQIERKMTSRNSLQALDNENKRTRIQYDDTTSSTHDDNQLVSLAQFMAEPAPFQPDCELIFSSIATIDELCNIITTLTHDCDGLTVLRDTIQGSLATIDTAMSKMESTSPINTMNIDSSVLQSSLESFAPQFEQLKEKLSSLRLSILCSTMELSRKGQSLQLNSVQMELKSHEEQITTIIQSSKSQFENIQQFLTSIIPIKSALNSIYLHLNDAKDAFEHEYQIITDQFYTQVDVLRNKCQEDIVDSRQGLEQSLERLQREFKDLYSSRYVAEVRAVEKAQELFEVVKKQHDELEQKHILLKDQLQGMDDLIKAKARNVSAEDYITSQHEQLDQSKIELQQLEEQCSSYDETILQERRVKLNKYQHHNQLLEIKIAQLGGTNLLLKLSANASASTKNPPRQSKSVTISISEPQSESMSVTSNTSSIYEDKEDDSEEMNDNSSSNAPLRSRATTLSTKPMTKVAPVAVTSSRVTLNTRQPLASRPTISMNQQSTATTASFSSRAIPHTTTVTTQKPLSSVTTAKSTGASRPTLSRLPPKPSSRPL